MTILVFVGYWDLVKCIVTSSDKILGSERACLQFRHVIESRLWTHFEELSRGISVQRCIFHSCGIKTKTTATILQIIKFPEWRWENFLVTPWSAWYFSTYGKNIHVGFKLQMKTTSTRSFCACSWVRYITQNDKRMHHHPYHPV